MPRTTIPPNLLSLLLLLSPLAHAQSTQPPSLSSAPSPTSTSTHPSGVNPETTGTPTATTSPGGDGYVYVGCYNETTEIEGAPGTRALSGPGSKMTGTDSLTPPTCFTFCTDTEYAGLQYSRECWCARFPSSRMERIDDSWCDMPCAGDAGVMCGGRLTYVIS